MNLEVEVRCVPDRHRWSRTSGWRDDGVFAYVFNCLSGSTKLTINPLGAAAGAAHKKEGEEKGKELEMQNGIVGLFCRGEDADDAFADCLFEASDVELQCAPCRCK